MTMTTTAAIDETQSHIAEIVRSHPVVLFMKGDPSFPQCGFSATVVAILQHHGIKAHTIDVLSNPAIRQGIKTYSDWPTIPQLYVGGAFVGGCDIIREMHETGELNELFAAVRAGTVL
jgi:monothiol glutaredoxin